SRIEEAAMENAPPRVSVVICTRNRGDSLVGTVQSILDNPHPSFEIIVVDQSTNDDTLTALQPFQADPRVCYIRSNTVGTGKARNIGLFAARGDIVAYTDDYCFVPKNWIQDLDDA